MTSQATLLCSTRYQVIATYDAYSSMEQALGDLPIVLRRIFQEYYGHADIPRSQENNSQARWQQLRDNPLFQSIALTTDLFRFAIHGMEKRLPQNLGERFRFIEQRIPTLYSRVQRLALNGPSGPDTETTIPSPLDLPRIPPITSSPSFDPYHPERWSVSQEKWRSFWQQRCTFYPVTAMHDIDRGQHLHNGNSRALDERFLLGSIITPQGAVYCRLLLQDIASSGSVDTRPVDTRRKNNETLHELSWLPIARKVVGSWVGTRPVDTRRANNETLHEFSWLPIARAAVESAPFKREDEVDFVLCASTGGGYDFVYRRVQDEPDADITDNETLHEFSRLLIASAVDESASFNRKANPDWVLCTSTDYDFICRRVQERPDADITDADFTPLRDMDAKLSEDTTLADHYGTSRTNAPPSSATATAQRDASSAPPEIPESAQKDTSKGNT